MSSVNLPDLMSEPTQYLPQGFNAEYLEPDILRPPDEGHRYSYTPIADPDSIRFVDILPGQPEDDVHCWISYGKLSSPPTYEALSYTWGRPVGTHRISCCGRYLRITRNLRAALRQLRHTERPRTLWVDAICINQKDLDERSLQVGKMPQIYSKAQQVIVWLGEAARDSDFLFDTLAEMESSFYMEELHEYHVRGLKTFPKKELPLPLLEDRRRSAVRKMFGRSWFTRVWVLQEVAFASSVRVVWGSRDISFDKIVALYWAEWRETRAGRRSSGFGMGDAMECVHEMQRQRCQPGRVGSWPQLLPLMSRTHQCRASDPRDKVYAMLSFASSTEVTTILRPDYTAPVEDLYNGMAEYWLESGTPILDLAGRSRQTTPLLYSWTPDWANQRAFPTLAVKSRAWNACGDSKTSFRVQTYCGRKTLVISGSVLDPIKVVTEVSAVDHDYPKTPEEFERFQQFHKWLRHVLDFDSCYFNGDSFPEAVARTLTANRHKYPAEEIVKLFNAWRHWIESNGAGEPEENCKLFCRTLKYLTTFSERQFALTEKGYTCLVPAVCAAEDIVCIFPGCKIPFVLRKKDESVELLGECYVHGLMYGEALSKMTSGPANVMNHSIEGRLEGLGLGTSLYSNQDTSTDSGGTSSSIHTDALPAGWRQTDDTSGAGTGFINDAMEIVTWDDPRRSQRVGPMPPGWSGGLCWDGLETTSEKRTPFFVNLMTGETTREDPGVPLREDGSILGGFRII